MSVAAVDASVTNPVLRNALTISTRELTFLVTNCMTQVAGTISLYLDRVGTSTGESILGFILGNAEVRAGGSSASHVQV